MKPSRSTAAAALVLAASLAWSPVARADDTIRRPGDHFPYVVDIEPHFAAAWGNWTGGLGGDAGYGIGARFSFPIVRNGFVPTINNSVAIGVGADFLHFGCAAGGTGCSLNSLSFPVVLQWSFYVSRQWTAFGEPGFFIYHQFLSYDGACNGRGCPGVTSTSALPAFAVGAKYSFNERLALTFRVGYPTVTIGVSFLD